MYGFRSMSLYRPEAIEAQRKRLYGVVTIHQPASLMVMTIIAVVVTLLTGAFLCTGSISRKETVTGWIVPEAGMAQVYTGKAGVAQRVTAKVGDVVSLGQPLAIVSVDVSTGQGDLAPQQLAMTRDRLNEIDGQIVASTRKQNEEALRLGAHARALRNEATHLQEELTLVDQQLALAKRELADIQPLVSRGFVATVEKDRREQVVFSTQQAWTDLKRQIDAKRADAADADAQVAALPTATALEVSQLRAQRATQTQNLAELAAQDTLVLKAPVAGRVAAVNLRAGDTAQTSAPLFSIAPSGGALTAELLAPTKAAGFISQGQKVQLMIDAFPFERFGHVDAAIDTISRAPVVPVQVGIPLDIKEPVYRLTARLATDHITAYGKAQALQPGMTFKASVITAKSTFLQWMIDPLLAAGRKVG